VSRHPLRHGVFVPQGWKLEYDGMDAAAAWERSREWALTAEALGWDHLWVYDHVETVPRRRRTHTFEAFTMLAALSQLTSRVELGQLVTCVGYRNVGLLAKQAACIDVMSAGRLVLGLGAGWYEREYAAYGYEFPSAQERLGLLGEALEVIPRLWSEETVTYEGHYIHLDEAFCEPQPLSLPGRPRPRILVGGGGERVTLRLAATHADATNWQVGLDAFVRKSAVLAEHCERLGRDPSTVVRTHGPDCLIVDSDADLRRWMDRHGADLWGEVGQDEWIRDNFVGTVEHVVDKAQAFVEAGCSEFILWCRDAPGDETMRAWMEEVVPRLVLNARDRSSP
jgi:F420-dependent oxidoreductase-like protein